MKAFIDEHRDAYGVEPICKVMQIAPSNYWLHAHWQRQPALRPARVQRDEMLSEQIERVYNANLRVYGARKVWQDQRLSLPLPILVILRTQNRVSVNSPFKRQMIDASVNALVV